MAQNPSKQTPILDSATQRKNSTNDPGFQENTGYYPYDLSHTEVFTALFGHIVPSCHLITTLGDRFVMQDSSKTILNQINGNFMNKVNQYSDSFFVSNRTLFPNNWDKLIPTKTHGDDLPFSAMPMVPLDSFFRSLLSGKTNYLLKNPIAGTHSVTLDSLSIGLQDLIESLVDIENWGDVYANSKFSFLISRLSLYAYILSRGQLFDHLGFAWDYPSTINYDGSFQKKIDKFFSAYSNYILKYSKLMVGVDVPLSSNSIDYSQSAWKTRFPYQTPRTLSEFRDSMMTIFEKGLMPYFEFKQEGYDIDSDKYDIEDAISLVDAITGLYNTLTIFSNNLSAPIVLDVSDDPWKNGNCYNISKLLAYQLVVAQYFTNDNVDNICTSDLFMQLLRAVMYPDTLNTGFSTEPVFSYNGVTTEYDYISYGAFYHALLNADRIGNVNRQYVYATLMFILRRSLRYGDYFTTARPNMLAVNGNVSIAVDENSMSVNPIDVTRNLLIQRYANAANRIGNKPLAYYSSIYGITPSDMGSQPRYVSHRKMELGNQITNNTAQNQGAQTTNLIGLSDDTAFDVFIDDFGVLLTLQSFDTLPIYYSGIDSDNRLADRYDYFNPMMQNIGDQVIRLSELIGNYNHYDSTFGYVVRNAEYKFKNSKAHGGAVYDLPGFSLKYPLNAFISQDGKTNINPDFIRDAPIILDPLIPQNTGVSPAQYWHFVISVHNSIKSAKLIQKAPALLF